MNQIVWGAGRRGRWLAVPVLAAIVAGCGGDGSQDYADRDSVILGTPVAGATPFIGSVAVSGAQISHLRRVDFQIDAKPSATARPVRVSFSLDYLKKRGDYVDGANQLTLPLFGLYAGTSNQVHVHLMFTDGSERSVSLTVATAAYVDPNAIYDRPVILTQRSAQQALGFDYFFMKSAYGPPVIVDSDGEIRWAQSGTSPSATSILRNNGFDTFGTGVKLSRLELDGTTSTIAQVQSASGNYTSFQHDIDRGKVGMLAMPDTVVDGVANVESTLAEISDTGAVLAEWRMADIIRNYMTAAGDDPTPIVRPGIDWFHMNSAVYDQRDDSLIVSSRENFVVKIDYSTGAIKWIFGDPTKYWYNSPSLRAKALTLAGGGLYPDGQHSVSIAPTGDLLLFDNGQPASYPPSAALQGENRAFSSVGSYDISADAGTATQVWSFDHGQTIKAPFCSSAEQTSDGSVLVSYATADNYAHARLVGLDPARNVVFDFQYNSPIPCATSWNAQVIALESLSFD